MTEKEGMLPLDGIKVIEMASLAPSPFCSMVLSDFGAEVVVVDRLISEADNHMILPENILDFGKQRIRVDLAKRDGAAPYYQVYETKDGKYMAVGPIEAQLYRPLLQGMGLDPPSMPEQNDTRAWPEMIHRFGEVFRTKT